MQRILLRFARRGDLKYLSHLETARTMARALRRAGLPVAFSQGFNPHPRLSFWHALPVGVEAQEEMAEVWLNDPVPLAEVVARLDRAMPDAMEVLEAVEIGEGEPRLTRRYTHAHYLIRVPGAPLRDAEDAAETLRKGLDADDGEIINVVAGEGDIEISLLADHREAGPRLRKLGRKTAECLGAVPESASVIRKGLYRDRASALAPGSGLEKI